MLSKTMLYKTVLPFLTTFLGHVYHCGAHLCHVICYTLPYFFTLSYILRHRIDNSGMKKKKKKGELFGGVKSSIEQKRAMLHDCKINMW